MRLKVGDAVWISDLNYPEENRHGWVITSIQSGDLKFPISIQHKRTGYNLECMAISELSLEEELEDILWE